MSTWTRFEKEAKANSEMAHSPGYAEEDSNTLNLNTHFIIIILVGLN